MIDVLDGQASPKSLTDAELLQGICTECMRELRAAKADCVYIVKAARKELLDFPNNAQQHGTTVESCVGVCAHIDRLMVAIERSKAQARAAVQAYRGAQVSDAPVHVAGNPDSLVARQLVGLHDLHERGVLTDEEFVRATGRLVP